MSIKVKTNNNTTTVRVGQQNAIKVVASNKSAAALGKMQEVTDVNIDARTTNTLLMFTIDFIGTIIYFHSVNCCRNKTI